MSPEADLPTLDELGRDLLNVAGWRRAWSLAAPFVLTAAFFPLAARGRYLAALACPVALSFLTYGSISHDLVHRTLRLPHWLNELLLSAIELLAFRCGHAYRAVHLHHHARFPARDDLEGAAAHMSFWRAVVEGLTLQPRLLLFATRHRSAELRWVIAEASLVTLLFGVCLAATPWSWLPLVFAGLMIAGSWVFPVVTSYIPHDVRGGSEVTQTRLFRGRLASWIAFEHLYHLEHHLYPGVPHHNWPALARRLDPHFQRMGLAPIVWLF